jgi:hypothetical protein
MMNRGDAPKRPFSKVFEKVAEAYFQEAKDSFSRASSQAGISRDLKLRLADIPFRLLLAGDAVVERILPSIAHLVVREDISAEWTLHGWDESSTASAMTMPTQEMMINQQHYCLPLVSNQRYRAFYQEWLETLSFIDREGEAYTCYLDAGRLPMYEKAAPMRQVFNAALNIHGKQIAHAAAVGYAHGSVLIAGPARSGKSTLAVQCLLQGMGYQSDDLCVISGEENPRSWSLYNVAKLRDDALARVSPDFPLLSFTEGEETKHYFHVNQIYPERILPVAPIKALLIPEITEEAQSRLIPVKRLDAMRALIPWSVSEVPTSDNLGERIMLKALGHFPAYQLRLGSDPKQTFELIKDLINAS